MSLATWCAEFYPVSADQCQPHEAVSHSLRKWIGLRRENRERHGLTVEGERYLTDDDGESFSVSASSCALCVHHYRGEIDSEGMVTDQPCATCPLAIARGGKACDEEDAGREPCSPWATWTYQSDPEPMIAALEKAQKEAP